MCKTTWIPVGVMLVCLLLVVCVVAPPWEKGFFDRGGSPQSADPVAEVPSSTAAPGPAPDGMVWIPPGQFNMGSDDGFPDEQPIHKVVLDGFWLDATEVTNAQFRRFVEATGYVTIAEKKPKREDFIGEIPDVNAIPEENLIAGSVCYNPDFDRTTLRKDSPLWPYQVWRYVAGANWCHPQGPDSSIEGLDDHPVVHVSHADAIAYCDWAKKRLPTEAEWEYAARGGKVGQLYPWGNTLCADGNWQTNIWQGDFPNENSAADGFITTAPVKQFSATEWGLYGMSGNVWEWCADFYRPDYYAKSARQNPLGPQESYDPNEPGVIKRIQRGGSFLCSDNYCTGYRVSARMKGEPRTGTYHCGFRCARSSAR